MVIKIPETIENVCMVGDIHGNLEKLTYHIRQFHITNTAFILCGDVGFGFESLKHYTDNFIPNLEKTLNKTNCIMYCIRGNHDDSIYYSQQLINTYYVKTIPDYTVIQFKDKNILCIGGGYSVDRFYRKSQNSLFIVDYMKWHNCDYSIAEQRAKKCYWEDEPPIYQPKLDMRIDIICTHSAPSFCFPIFKGDFVFD